MEMRAWLEISRCSNLPTVWSNVAAGMAWGWHASMVAGRDHPNFLAYRPVLDVWTLFNNAFVLMVAASLLYTGGMLLNDAFDAELDAGERPGRPIPSGRIARRTAFGVGGLMLLLGLMACVPYAGSPWTLPLAVGIATLIVAYNALHARFSLATLGVPLCRGLLAFLAAMTIAGGAWGPTWVAGLHGTALFVFVLIISLWARGEVPAGRASRVGLALSTIALVDATILAAVGQWPIAGFCLACFAMAWAAQSMVRGS
ncbi:MAG: UbiA family prenyltransferase [Planctomycetota bacterium]